MSLESLAWHTNKKIRMYAMSKQNVIVSKTVKGQKQEIKNAVSCALIADLLTTNPASQAALEVCQNSDFLKLATTGEGEYSVHVQKLAEDNSTIENEYTVTMAKAKIAEYAKGVIAIGKAIESVIGLKSIDGEMGARGRKSLVADFSEL
jgi:hypothetical protein